MPSDVLKSLKSRQSSLSSAMSNARDLAQELAMLELQMAETVQDNAAPAVEGINLRPSTQQPGGLLERMLTQARESNIPGRIPSNSSLTGEGLTLSCYDV